MIKPVLMAAISGMLVTGGDTGESVTRGCWLLSTSNFQWTAVAELNTGRYRHISVSVGSQTYVVGGVDGDQNPLSSVECLSDISARWDKMPNLPKAMYRAIAISCRGQLFVFGGRTYDNVYVSSFVFRKNQSDWQVLPDMPRKCEFGSGVAFKSKIYVVGRLQQSCLCYDPMLSQWTAMSQCRHEHADGPALVWNDRIFICGGQDCKAKYDDGLPGGTSVIEEYDPETDTWTLFQIELPQRLSSHFVFSIESNDKI